MSDIERNQFGDERSWPQRSQPGLGGQGGQGDQGGAHGASEREFDALLNAALDAEALGDIALAQESWAKIAAMDEARRRSAALLASGLAQLKQGNQQQVDVSASVLARLSIAQTDRAQTDRARTDWDRNTIQTMPDAVTAETAPAREVSGTAQAMDHMVGEGRREARRNAALTDERHAADALAMEQAADAVISTGRPWGLPSQRASQHRKRRWYQVSPMLASFVLGGTVTIGLVMIKHWSDAPAPSAAPIVAAAPAPAAAPSQLVPQLVQSTPAPRPALQMGDTQRYTRIDGLTPGWRMSQTPAGGRWWDAGGTDAPGLSPVMSMDGASPFAKAVRPKGTLPEGVPRAATAGTSGNTLWFNMLEDDDVLIVDSHPLIELRPSSPRTPPARDVPPR